MESTDAGDVVLGEVVVVGMREQDDVRLGIIGYVNRVHVDLQARPLYSYGRAAEPSDAVELVADVDPGRWRKKERGANLTAPAGAKKWRVAEQGSGQFGSFSCDRGTGWCVSGGKNPAHTCARFRTSSQIRCRSVDADQ